MFILAETAPPEWLSWVGQISAGVGAILLIAWFLKQGLPKILDGFTTSLQQQRNDYREERSADRVVTKEATTATQSTALAMARLSDSMDRFSEKLDDLPERIRLSTTRKATPTEEEMKAARAQLACVEGEIRQ